MVRNQLGRRGAAAATECRGHHWHCVESGWDCCHCPGHTGRGQAQPDSTTEECDAVVEPAVEAEALASWLAEPHETAIRPAGERWGA